jgi:hypothetical protein
MSDDVPNMFDVQGQGGHVHIRRGLGSQILTHADALNLAAHLVATADPEGEFDQLLEAVRDQVDPREG